MPKTRSDHAVSNCDPLELIDTQQFCKLLRVSQRSLERWLSSGKLPQPVALPGRVRRWRRQDIERWMANQS